MNVAVMITKPYGIDRATAIAVAHDEDDNDNDEKISTKTNYYGGALRLTGVSHRHNGIN